MYDKTIFIVVTRGYMVREFLRSGFLGLLKDCNLRIVVLLMSPKDKPLPSYLREEFENKNVILRTIGEPKVTSFFGRAYRKFCELTALLVYSKTTWMYLRVGNARNVEKTGLRVCLASLVFGVLGKFAFLKNIVRFIDSKLSIDGGSM